MKKQKLILISIHIKNSPQAMPLAAAMLKAKLDSIPEISSKLETSFIDFFIDESAESIAEEIFKKSPDLIGFSTYLWNRQLTENLCRIIKNRFPDTILFAGGAEATALPHNLLNSAPFDFVVKGEGELALTEIMKRIVKNSSYNNINGVFYKNKLNNSSESQSPVIDLDSLPSPFLSGVLDVKKYSGILWELSRGCPFKCSFCFESRGVSGVRQFSIDRLQKELELFESKKVNQVFVLDPTFNRDVHRSKKILRMILKTAPLMHFTFEVRTEFIDKEMAGLFAQINCSLQIGLQSAVPEVLSNVNRKIEPDKYAEKIALLNADGIIFGLDLIYGLPGDTPEGFRHSLNYALNLQPNHLDIFPLAVLPGTALFDEAPAFRLNSLDCAPYTLISSPDFSESDMADAETLKNACSIIYNKGGAAGWMYMVIETLNIDPADLLENFAEFISGRKIKEESDRDEITNLQRSFVKDLFTRYDILNLFPAMEDIIILNGALNRSLHAGTYDGEITTIFNGNTYFKISPGTILLALKYNFDELMTLGEFTLEDFIINYRPEKTFVIIYNCGGEIKPLIVDKEIYKLMKTFSDKLTLNEVSMMIPSIPKKEMHEFIEYALDERIICIL